MIIVTGSKGFIGKHFVNYIQEAYRNPTPQNRKYTSNVLEIDEDNCWDFLENYDHWNTVELIIHQGAISSTTETDVDKLHKMNVKFTIELFKKAICNLVPIKFASSASVYGHLNKENLVNPLNYYAITKLQTDYWIQDHMDEFKSYKQISKGFETEHPSIQSFRYFNVYGDRAPQRGQYAPVIGIFNRQRTAGEPLTIVGDGEQRRDFIHVSDVVRANILAATMDVDDKSYGKVYNVGTGKNYSVNQIADWISDNQTNIPPRKGEVRESLAYIQRIKNTFGWKPRVDLEQWVKAHD